MARPLRIEYPGAFYHVTARGNERRDIFNDEKDKDRFLKYLESAVSRYKAAIHVYCLMDNHYHLLLSTPSGNLSQIVRHINGAYTAYFNKRHRRSGHLFQGRYKAILVDADEYAGALSRYIHLNPVRAGIVKKPESYLWSSYAGYVGWHKASVWLTTDWLLLYFGKRLADAQKAYRAFVEAELGSEEEYPLKSAVASTILGRPDFVEKIRRKYLAERKKNREIPALAALTKVGMEMIIEQAKLAFEDRPDYARKASIYLGHRFSGLSLKEIGLGFGITESGVTQTSRRFEAALLENGQLRKRVEKMRAALNLLNLSNV